MQSSLFYVLLFMSILVNSVCIATKPIVNEVMLNQQTILVSLPANPTTGYQWQIVSYDKAILQKVAEKYIHSKTNLIGAGGTMLFTFQRFKNLPCRNTSILFKYAHPWDKNAQSKQTLKKVTINCQG